MRKELLSDYLKRCRRKGVAARTVAQYASVLERFLAAVAFPAAGIDAVEDYFGKIAEKYAANTVRLHAAILSGFFNWCVRRGVINHNYVKDDVAVPRLKHVHPNIADVASVKAVVADGAVPLRARVAVALGYYCGLRRSEIARLRVADIDLERNVVHVLGKGGKERTVPVGNGAWAVIAEYLAARNAEYVFGPLGGRGVNEATIWRWTRKYADTNPHALRHAMGVEATRKGVPLATLSRHLGHESPATTYLYTRMAATDIKEVAEIL